MTEEVAQSSPSPTLPRLLRIHTDMNKKTIWSQLEFLGIINITGIIGINRIIGTDALKAMNHYTACATVSVWGRCVVGIVVHRSNRGEPVGTETRKRPVRPSLDCSEFLGIINTTGIIGINGIIKTD